MTSRLAVIDAPDDHRYLTDAPTIAEPRRRSRALGVAGAALVVAIVAVLARCATFGNPVVHIDEQFYLLVGGRMLHGAIPYVDIWDRKPIGLFLLFAAIRLLGGSGVWQYQICALLFVIATAMLLFAMARRIAGPKAALGSALLYIVFLNLADGQGGQAPVWYNLPVAGAIAIIFFARTPRQGGAGNFRWPGVAAMLLFGLAMQIKYSAMFEGLFAGCALIGLSHHRRRPLAALAVDVALWIGCAVLPTLLAAGGYAAIGHFHEWLFSNFTSILTRGAEQPYTVDRRVRAMATLVVPLVLAIPLRRWAGLAPASEAVREDVRFLDAWAASALLGVVLFGTWFNHYALPLFAPFAVTAAPIAGWAARRTAPVAARARLGVRRWRSIHGGRVYFALLLAVPALIGQHILYRHRIVRGDGAMLDRATAAMADHRTCIFVYDGPPAIYDTTRSCLPSPHMFPAHLQELIERNATGIVQEDEVRRIMAGRPDRVMSMEPAYDEENRAARAILYRALRQDYSEIYRYKGGPRSYVVYGLKGTLPPGPPGRNVHPVGGDSGAPT